MRVRRQYLSPARSPPCCQSSDPRTRRLVDCGRRAGRSPGPASAVSRCLKPHACGCLLHCLSAAAQPGGLKAPGLAESSATRGPKHGVLLGDADPEVWKAPQTSLQLQTKRAMQLRGLLTPEQPAESSPENASFPLPLQKAKGEGLNFCDLQNLSWKTAAAVDDDGL